MKYSWKPSTPDHRDHYYQGVNLALPAKVAPFDNLNPVEDQSQLGSCTGNSSTTALEITLGGTTQYSRLMAYYNARAIEGTIKQDAGAQIRDVIKGFANTGVCTETAWPYNIKQFAKKPAAAAFKEAKLLPPKVKSYERVTSLDGFKTALAAGLPVIFGFSVPEFFESADVAKNGLVRYPSKSDKIIGGHAVCAVGYDDAKGVVWVRNSWGKDWGLNGDFMMVYQWFNSIDTSSSLVSDCWVIHKA